MLNSSKQAISSRRIDRASELGIDFLRRSQLRHGEFKIYISGDRELTRCSLDSCTTPTSWVLYSANFVSHPAIETMAAKARAFLMREVEEPGIWRYWTSTKAHLIDPDLDDTCLISALLRQHQPAIREGANIDAILSNRNRDGLFLTWFRPKAARNDVDSVVNANALFYLGQREETVVVCEFLNRLISKSGERGSFWYYPDDLCLYYAISRAFWHGISALQPSKAPILSKIEARHQHGGMLEDPLLHAYAVCTLLNFGCKDHPAINGALRVILRSQRKDGAWPRSTSWMGPEPPGPYSVFWGGEEITTAICLEALARYHVSRYARKAPSKWNTSRDGR